MMRLVKMRQGAAFSDTPAEDVSARSAAESASGNGDAGISNPERTDQSPETPDSGHEQAMMKAQSGLSAKAAMIARKIPRIEPLLRMIEESGFKVIGLKSLPVTAQPVRMMHTSPGSRAFYRLLERRGYTVALSDPSEETGTARNAAEPAFRKAGQYEHP